MQQWFAVHTRMREEALAQRHLDRQGFEAYLPRYAKRRRHARRIERVAAPLFPRYLFVRMDTDACRWRAIHSTVGVSYLVCHGDSPAPLPDGVIDDIRAREDAAGMVALDAEPPPFEKGQAVRVTGGALADQVGFFDCVSDDERVILLLDLLGRQIKVRVPLASVTAYA